MKILVAGTGAVGGYFGGLLANSGEDVSFLARGENLKALKKNGLKVKSVNGDFSFKVRVSKKPPAGKTFDVIFLAAKAHQGAALLPDLVAAATPKTVILPLQNGVNQAEPLVKVFGKNRVIGSLVYLAAYLEKPGVIRHLASGRILLGELDGEKTARVEQLAIVLAKAGIPVEVTGDLNRKLWEKLVWNVGFNAATTLVDLTVGEILEREEQRVLIKSLMAETVAVAHKRGIAIGADYPELLLKSSGKDFHGAITSMLWDRRRHRPLEWQIFQGFICEEGRRLGVPTPANDAVAKLLEAIDPGGPGGKDGSR
jgi:2-dehydropantoate 2-reductase